MKALFQSQSEPVVLPEGQRPVPGPNAVEVAVIQYDPDQRLIVISMPGDIQLAAELDKVQPEGTDPMTLLLEDARLGPKVKITIHPKATPPKFTSPEEADAWLEANS